MINRSKLITSIKYKLGLHALNSPDFDIDEMITEVIEEETLMVFNELMPNIVSLTLDMNEFKKDESSFDNTTYILPDIFGGKEILGIDNVIPYDRYMMQSSPYSEGLLQSAGDLMMGQLNADLYSLIDPGFSFDFTAPNKLHVYNLDTYHNKLTIKFKVEHDTSLISIPKSAYSSFKKLALLDAKIVLYENLKHYDGIETAHGRIDLKISEWSNAESERNDLVKGWEDTYHFNGTQLFYI